MDDSRGDSSRRVVSAVTDSVSVVGGSLAGRGAYSLIMMSLARPADSFAN